jgi:hypothetical protein
MRARQRTRQQEVNRFVLSDNDLMQALSYGLNSINEGLYFFLGKGSRSVAHGRKTLMSAIQSMRSRYIIRDEEANEISRQRFRFPLPLYKY